MKEQGGHIKLAKTDHSIPFRGRESNPDSSTGHKLTLPYFPRICNCVLIEERIRQERHWLSNGDKVGCKVILDVYKFQRQDGQSCRVS